MSTTKNKNWYMLTDQEKKEERVKEKIVKDMKKKIKESQLKLFR